MQAKLVKKEKEAKGTVSFYFLPERKVPFLPGQYFYFTLPYLTYPDPRGATRHFTISLSPTESDYLRITTRIRDESGFKKTLDELKMEKFVEIDGPSGTLILDEGEKGGEHIFLAGGIGITPFRVFIKYNLDKKLNIPMHLIYSCSEENEVVYKKELEEWSKIYPFIKVDFVISAKDGRLDPGKLKQYIKKSNYKDPTWWVVGPPTYVNAIEEILEKIEVPSDKIRVEKFTGY